MCVCVWSQPYFRSSRASVWECDSEAASGPLSHPSMPSLSLASLQPPPPLTPHPQTPPRGPETDASALRPSSSQTDKRERSFPDHRLLPDPDPRPSISVYKCCRLWYWQLFYGQSKKPRWLENMCASLLTWHLFAWRCETECGQWFLLTMCHICLFQCLSVLCENDVFSNKCQAFREQLVFLLLL